MVEEEGVGRGHNVERGGGRERGGEEGEETCYMLLVESRMRGSGGVEGGR